MRHRTSLLRLLVALCAAVLLIGCPAVYPELPTRMRKVVAEQALDPPPPDNMAWMKFESARIIDRTRTGKPWQEEHGTKPSPFAKLLINGREVMRTPVESGTFEPTWPKGPRGNFRIEPGDKLRLELWHADTVTDRPISVRDVGHPTDEHRMARRIRVELETGGELVLAYEPAKAMIGLGLWYELRAESVFITRMLPSSPAERAGILAGDEVIKINGKDVKPMGQGEVRSAFNAVSSEGVRLTLKHPDGVLLDITVKEGAIYPPFDEFGPIE